MRLTPLTGFPADGDKIPSKIRQHPETTLLKSPGSLLKKRNTAILAVQACGCPKRPYGPGEMGFNLLPGVSLCCCGRQTSLAGKSCAG